MTSTASSNTTLCICRSQLLSICLCVYLYVFVHVFLDKAPARAHTHTHAHTVCLSLSLSLSLCIYIYRYVYSCVRERIAVQLDTYMRTLIDASSTQLLHDPGIGCASSPGSSTTMTKAPSQSVSNPRCCRGRRFFPVKVYYPSIS